MEDFYRLIIHFGTFEPKTATDFSLFSVTFSFFVMLSLDVHIVLQVYRLLRQNGRSYSVTRRKNRSKNAQFWLHRPELCKPP
jgi:hypothetical protein